MKMDLVVPPMPRIDRARIKPQMTADARAASVRIKDDLQQLTPRRTGRMRASWTRRVTSTANTVTITLGNTAPYGPFVHYKGRPNDRVMEAAAARFRAEAEALGQQTSRRIFQQQLKQED